MSTTPSKAGSALSTARAAFSHARNLTDSAASGDFVSFGTETLDGILSACEGLRSKGDAALQRIAKEQQGQVQAQGQAPTQEQGRSQGQAPEHEFIAGMAPE